MTNLLKIRGCLVVTLLICGCGIASAQRPQRNPRFDGVFGPKSAGAGQLGKRGGIRPGQGQQRPNNQQMLMQRIMRAIGLSPEQEQRMQQIRQAHSDEVISAGRRIRQARRTLDQAIMSQYYNEAEVNRRIDELAQAQYEQVRLRQHIRAEIRQVLTPEQVTKFVEIQRELQREIRQRRNMELEQQDGAGQRPPGESELIDPLDVLISPPSPRPPAGGSDR